MRQRHPFEIVAHVGATEVGRHIVTRRADRSEAVAEAEDYAARHPLFTVYVWHHVTNRTKLLTHYTRNERIEQ
jgi:hypothetical protein